MSRLVRAFPILPGKEAFARSLARQIMARGTEAAAFYAKFGVTHESWHLQQTPTGSWIIGITDVTQRPIADVATDYSATQHPFDRWFKDQVREMSGVDPDKTPLGPPTECILSWPA